MQWDGEIIVNEYDFSECLLAPDEFIGGLVGISTCKIAMVATDGDSRIFIFDTQTKEFYIKNPLSTDIVLRSDDLAYFSVQEFPDYSLFFCK